MSSISQGYPHRILSLIPSFLLVHYSITHGPWIIKFVVSPINIKKHHSTFISIQSIIYKFIFYTVDNHTISICLMLKITIAPVPGCRASTPFTPVTAFAVTQKECEVNPGSIGVPFIKFIKRVGGLSKIRSRTGHVTLLSLFLDLLICNHQRVFCRTMFLEWMIMDLRPLAGDNCQELEATNI